MGASATLLALGAVVYLAAVRAFRYRRSNAVCRKYPSREHMGSMTLEEAFQIQSALANVEFPTVFSGSTYGIPSISRLLAATGQLSNSDTASKRAADTGVILTEVVLHHPSDPRTIDGIARMNFLHDRYRRSGKISNEDMLYTLSLFLLEPIRWTNRFDWREVNDVERCAMGTYWRWMGEAMEISFEPLRGSESGWTDGLQFLEILEEWSLAYEVENMVPADTNEAVATHTIDIALFNLPKIAHGAAFDVVSALLSPRLRTAMKFKGPSIYSTVLLNALVKVRRFVICHLAPPRPHFMRKRWWSETANSQGKFTFGRYIAHPWYIKPTLTNRWGLKALLLRLVGGAIPGDDGDKYCPMGYKISELGPEALREKGGPDMAATRERLAHNDRIGCPFVRW